MSTKKQDSTKVLEKVTRPRKYKVIMFNDDFTPMEFVTMILETIFNKSAAEATRIMLTVHRQGSGVAGVYTKEIAVTKKERATQLSREKGYPLMMDIEPE